MLSTKIAFAKNVLGEEYDLMIEDLEQYGSYTYELFDSCSYMEREAVLRCLDFLGFSHRWCEETSYIQVFI